MNVTMYGGSLSRLVVTPLKITLPEPVAPVKVCPGTVWAAAENVGSPVGQEMTPAGVRLAIAVGTDAGQEMMPAAVAVCESIT